MKDVAILTKYYRNYNYGGMLQGYALYEVISQMGCSCNIISYDVNKNRNPVYNNVFQQCKQYGGRAALNKFIEKILGKCKFVIKGVLEDRIYLFEEFMNWVDAGTEIYDDSNLKELNSKYRVFISGSDQVWNPNAVRNMYLQGFVDDRNKRVSYAASIGREEFSTYEADILIPALKKFDLLSVREKTAKNLLQKHMQKDIMTVLDPTMLLTINDWEKVASPRMYEQPYALFYFFSDSLQIRKAASKFCKAKGLKMVMIPYAKQEYNLTDSLGKCIRLQKVGPKEFVSSVKYADFVFTDSFHGAVFSIIYQKQFVVFERNKIGHVSMNSRLYDLLEVFDLSKRLIKNLSTKIEELEEIDYLMVKNKLYELQSSSLQFIKEAIEL